MTKFKRGILSKIFVVGAYCNSIYIKKMTAFESALLTTFVNIQIPFNVAQ